MIINQIYGSRDNTKNVEMLKGIIDGSATSVAIPEGTTKIRKKFFQQCSELTSVTIPDSVTSIGEFAFSECTGLTSVTIPAGVTAIAQDTFYNCTALTSVTFAENSQLSTIGLRGFRGTGLTSITLPASLTSIDSYAFAECASLTEMTILATTPPTLLASTALPSVITSIYVPAESVDAYKTSWASLSGVASKIKAIGSTEAQTYTLAITQNMATPPTEFLYYSIDNGGSWTLVKSYPTVVNCSQIKFALNPARLDTYYGARLDYDFTSAKLISNGDDYIYNSDIGTSKIDYDGSSIKVIESDNLTIYAEDTAVTLTCEKT